MKKVYSVEGLKCGHCASKIQDQIEKLHDVESCILNFYTKKITVEIKDSVDEKEFLNTINKIADKTEKGSKIFEMSGSEKNNVSEEHKGCECGHHHHEHNHGHKHAHNHGECGCKGHHHHEEESCGCGHSHDDEESCGCGHSHDDEESCSCGHSHEEEGKVHNHEHGHSHHHGHSHTHDLKLNKESSNEEHQKINYEKISLFGGIALFIISIFIPNVEIKTAFLLIAYIVAGGDILYRSLLNIKNGNFLDENFLMSIATIGALFLREYREAVGVMIFYKVGEYFQERAVNNSRKSIQSLLEVKANYANLKLHDGTIKQVDPETLSVNDIIIIKPGEKVAVDGVVEKGTSSLNTAALTGESLPVFVEKGTEILSGSLNIDGMIEVRVTKEYKDSAISKICLLYTSDAADE